MAGSKQVIWNCIEKKKSSGTCCTAFCTDWKTVKETCSFRDKLQDLASQCANTSVLKCCKLSILLEGTLLLIIHILYIKATFLLTLNLGQWSVNQDKVSISASLCTLTWAWTDQDKKIECLSKATDKSKACHLDTCCDVDKDLCVVA